MKKYYVEQAILTMNGHGDYHTFKESYNLNEAKTYFNDLINDEKNYKDYCRFKDVLAGKAYIETMLSVINDEDDGFIDVLDVDRLTGDAYKERFLKEEESE